METFNWVTLVSESLRAFYFSNNNNNNKKEKREIKKTVMERVRGWLDDSFLSLPLFLIDIIRNTLSFSKQKNKKFTIFHTNFLIIY